MKAIDRITERLTKAFSPAEVKVVDESDLHKGHQGHRPGGETHFRLTIVAEAFRAKGRVETHRMVYEALADEMAAGVHALAIDARAPHESGV